MAQTTRGHISSNVVPQVGRYLETIATALACAVVACLAAMSVIVTGRFEAPLPEDNYPVSAITTERMRLDYGIHSPLFLLGVPLMITFVIVVAHLWSRRQPPRGASQSHGTVIFLCLYTLFAALTWALSLNLTGNLFSYSDSISLIDSANALVAGNYDLFSPSAPGNPPLYEYYSWYPFQTGAMLWFALLFQLFGQGNLYAILAVNIAMAVGTVWALYRIGESIGLSETGKRVEALLIMTSVPLLMSPTFLYPNATGLFLALLAVLVALRSMAQTSQVRSAAFLTGAFGIGALAMAVKGTTILFMLAIAITVGVSALRRRMYWLLPLDLVLLLAANKLSGIPAMITEHLVGQEFGSGLAQLSWIAIGLSQHGLNSVTNMPGWWNGSAIAAYRMTDGDPAAQRQLALDAISQSWQGIVAEPHGIWNFFFAKAASEWAEPSYQTLYYATLGERRGNSFIASAAFWGKGNTALLGFENVHQTVVYCFAALGFGLGARKASDAWCLVGTSVLGGFCCFLLWEAKSVYILPFALMMIPAAAYGLQRTGEFTRQLWNKHTNAQRQNPASEQE